MRTRLPALLALLLLLTAAPTFGQSAQPAEEASAPTVMENPERVRQYQETITPEDLAAYLYVYASDYFKGRETTMPGQHLATTYLAGQYRKLGLEPKGTTETDDPYAPEAYFQPFTVYGRRLRETTLTTTQGGETLFQSRHSLDDPGTDAYPALSSMRDSVAAPVVFAGYGIAGDSTSAYSDYRAMQQKGLSPQGKWLLILRDEPMADSTTSLIQDGPPTDRTLDDRYNSTDDPNRFYARSDHYNFGKHDVPFNFFFTGTHEDYHQVGDEADEIRYGRFAKVARFIFGTAWQLANQEERPAVSNPGLFE